MKYFIAFLLWISLVEAHAQAVQKRLVTDTPVLEFEASLNNYFFKDDYIFNPVMTADKGTLHLEGRYNYEDLNTLSLFGGYNIEAGNELYFEFTPMIGFAFGSTNGVIPALEFTVTYGSFEWYNESEHVLVTDEGGDNFFYAWTEFNYYPADWLSLGVIATRTRLYEMDSDLQGGVSLGYYQEDLRIMASLMNLDFKDPILYVSLSYRFP
jgi:hypothetical protein